MFNKDNQNILDIKEAVVKILDYTCNIKNLQEFEENNLIFDAVLMNIVVIGESVNRISDSFKSSYNYIEWSKIKGLRNIIAHDYFGIDVEEIWQIVQTTIPEFQEQIDVIMENLRIN